MDVFKSFISVMAYASLGFSLAAAYLKLNKIWKRKHIAEVANSVSIMGNVVDIIPLTFFALNFLLVAQWQGLIDSIIWIFAGALSVAIGSGMWVRNQPRKSFWKRLKEALRLERSEVGHLATTLFRPSGAELILEIFLRFAYIDRELADRERALIEGFANSWKLDIDWQAQAALAEEDRPTRLIETRRRVEAYVQTSPAPEQVAELMDILDALVAADDEVAEEEALLLDEVKGLLNTCIDDAAAGGGIQVVIAPQNPEQDSAIATMLPGVEKIAIAGGSGYLVGEYYSRSYAGVIRDQYRTLGFLTIELLSEN
ncbi:MAG: hypothetical protein AAF515_08030 [Pseudomonadota bacterium]